jgi:hypothetical protein
MSAEWPSITQRSNPKWGDTIISLLKVLMEVTMLTYYWITAVLITGMR